jgi:CheY-like chemotaxis protein
MTDTIIMADPSEASAIRTRTILSDLGYDAHVTLSAAEALQAFRKLSPAMVLIPAIAGQLHDGPAESRR